MQTAESVRARDDAAIVATAYDYFEGWFDGDVERMRRALHPDQAKRRFGDGVDAVRTTTAERMLELTERREGRADAADRMIAVEVADVYGDIASAIVHTSVYHEYLHLVRTADGWKIANAMWQLS